jgi:hypothetical protein
VYRSRRLGDWPRVFLAVPGSPAATGCALRSLTVDAGASLLPELGATTTPRVPAARASLTAGGGDTLATVMDWTRLSLIALLLT